MSKAQSSAPAADLSDDLEEGDLDSLATSTNPDADRQTMKVYEGIEDNPELEAYLGALTTDSDELVEGGLTSYDGTIVGMGFDPGGEIKKNSKGEEFTTSPQIKLSVRVDNREELGLPETFTHTTIFLAVPKKTADGRIGEPSKNSKYGIFVDNLDFIGIGASAERAEHYRLANFRDIVGMQGHFEEKEFETYKGQTTRATVLTEPFGFDNAIRVAHGMAEAYLKGQEPAPAAKAAARK